MTPMITRGHAQSFRQKSKVSYVFQLAESRYTWSGVLLKKKSRTLGLTGACACRPCISLS